ncbi:hypothetical protein [Ferruginibacter sp.]|uniref:hypothetical protein n=1 Tax=Ferruginibacter sp. TaxID=1940288 RepID=UPI00265952EB|nr:hypothetical protein [Ferruginibacter sp.]
MKHIKIDEQSKFLLVVILLSMLLFNNGVYLFVPLAVFFIIFYNLQQPFKPAVFSLIVAQHFVNIVAAVWLANYLEKDVNYRSPSQATAIIACSIGLVFLMAPILYFQNKLSAQTRFTLRGYVDQFSSEKVMYAYIIAYFATSSLGAVAFLFGGLTQIIFSLVKIKWILFLLFGFQCFLKDENKKMFYLFVVLEFLSGFLSFFSDFKTVIFYLAVLILTLVDKLSFKQIFSVIVIGILLGFFGLIWTNVKGEYRSFLNSGSSQQVVGVESDAALNKLYDLSSEVNDEKLNGSVVQMLDRLQYTYHFAKTIDRMPSVLPFEYGDNWLSSLSFATTPRFLNPDKPTYDATAKVIKYTGLRYLGKEHGVSFSLGYFADCFIDLGLIGMMFILLLLGFLYAKIYFYIIKNASKNIVFNYCAVCAFFMEFNALEMDCTFILGRLFATVVTFFVLIKFFFPWLIRHLSAGIEKKEVVPGAQ